MDFGLMGFVRRKTYRLKFTGDLQGLEVVTRPLPTGDYLELLGLLAEKPASTRPDDVRTWVERTFGLFCEALVSWNLEDEDGRPVPATLEGFASQDNELCTAVVNAYIDAVSEVPAPLEQPSSGGVPSLEGSIPMEPLSPSLAS